MSSKDKITFPRNWNKLSDDGQKEWINQHFMVKQKMPEPVLRNDDVINELVIQTESGKTIKSKNREIEVSIKNPNLVREFEAWHGNLLFTVFHDKSCPATKIFGISNPHSRKWIAKQLSPELISDLYAIILKIRWKYGLFKGKKRKKRR